MKLNQLKTTLILGIALAVLAGIGWWLSGSQETAVNKKIVLKYPVDRITRLEITRTDGQGKPELVKLELQGKKWRITAPLQDEANTSAMNNITDLFNKLEVQETITDYQNLREFGLDKPAVTVKVFGPQKRQFEFRLGAETPMNYEYYAKFAGKRAVYVVPGNFRTALNIEINQLRQQKTK